jgi:imidazolonepropionase
MASKKKATLLITNIGQLVTMQGPSPRIGSSMNDLGLIRHGAVAVAGDEIVAVGESDKVVGQSTLALNCKVIDAAGGVVTPGLIDPHTHPIFAATREDEFEMRLQGKSYMEIARAGGGIRRSVRDLRDASRELLMARARTRLDRFLEHGVTTIEAKSGYGLSLESEIKQLELIRDLDELHAIDLVPTFLGAHEFPEEYRDRHEEYVDLLIHEMIPAVASAKLAVFSDIFCEDGVFTNEQSLRVQTAARSHGLKLKFHADELASTGGAELAASLKATSADHLVFISEAGIKALAESGTAAVMLPGTSYSLGSKKYAPARDLIQSGAVVAISTDCNPGSNNSESLPMMMSLAAVHMKMTAAEALCAATVNAAYAIGRHDRLGMVETGYPADLVIWDMADYREIPYHYGVNLVRTVIKKGKVAVSRD